MRIPFGKPFPAIDTTSLRDGAAAGLINGYINELDDFQMVPGHTLFATHGAAAPMDALYETLAGDLLTVTNGTVVKVTAAGTFIAFSGDTVTPDTFYYWAEDQQHVYLAHGGKIARLDMANLTCTLLNENTPSNVTHIVRAKGFLLCNGNDQLISSSLFALSQVFDNTAEITAIARIDDQPGWILMSGSNTTAPGNVGRIYLSKDNGLSWTKVHTMTANTAVNCLCYMSGGVVLAGTGISTGRILRSTNYGVTWTDLGQLGAQTFIQFIVKVDTNIAIAGGGTLGVCYRSIDNGLTWPAIATPADFGTQTVTVVQRISAIVWSSTIVTIGCSDFPGVAHIWRSIDGGVTFIDNATLDADAYVIAGISVTSSIGLVAVRIDTAGNPPTGKIYRSTDGGATWADVGAILGLEVGAIPSAFLLTSTGDLLFGTSGNLATVGGAQIWKSNDDGVTWHRVTQLDTSDQALINPGAMAETHTAGQIIVGGRTLIENTETDITAAKWQTGTGRNAPQGDVFYSEDIANNYEAVDSWERFNAQSTPDAATGVFENRGLVYAAGPRSIEINFNSPDPDFPWQVSDPSLPFGLGGPNTWVNYEDENIVMYLSCTDKVWEVVKFQGRQQRSISQPYAAILNDRTVISSPETAKAWGVVMRGIPMYVLSFQDDNLTICYNLVKDHWFRWARFTGTAFEAAIVNSYVYSKTLKKHLIGDRRANGKIFELTGTADDGAEMRFELTSGHIEAGSFSPKPVGRMLFKMKRGNVTDASEPHVCWYARDNGNKNFAPGRPVSLGLKDNMEFFGYLNRCGMYHTRQHKLTYVGTKTELIISEVDES